MTESAFDRKSTEFGVHKGFVYKLAKKYHGRVMGARLSMDFDDVIGELSIAFVHASRGYKVDSGYAFTTYFGMCAQNHMNKVLGKMCREQYGEDVPDEDCVAGVRTNRFGLGLISFEEITSSDGPDPVDYRFEDTDSMTPEQCVDAIGSIQGIINDQTLSLETRAYIGILVNPSLQTDRVMRRIEQNKEQVMAEIKDRWGISFRSL